MTRKPVVCLACLAGALAAASAWGAAFHGGLELSDSSNADRPVGASVESGIPQGHTLRIAVVDARFGGEPAAGAAVSVGVRSGAQTVATGRGTLDGAGRGEVLVPVGAAWEGQYHVDAEVTGGAGTGRLEREFRVIAGEPSPEVPFALPAVLTVLAAAALVIWWTRRAPQAA
ncbi:MAG: hypothetical protein ACYTKD_22465 [Planctomycetota bacterium]